jgi:3-methyladenine DNA glycosylase Tag
LTDRETEVLALVARGTPRSIAGIPSSTPQAEALARQLKAQGYRFVGPTSI